MIVCADCGHSNPDNTEFCRSCNAFLGWEGARVDHGSAPGADVRAGRDTDAGGGLDAAPTSSSSGGPTSGTAGGATSGTSGGATSAGARRIGGGAALVGGGGGSGSASGGGSDSSASGSGSSGSGTGSSASGSGSGGRGRGPGGGAGPDGGGPDGGGPGGQGTALVEKAADTRTRDTGARATAHDRAAGPDRVPGQDRVQGQATSGADAVSSTADRIDTAAEQAAGASAVDARQPVARQPGPIPYRRPVRPVDEPRPQQASGERICPSCGRGNESTRRFCGTCGSSLEIVAEEERLPWWRRLLNRLTQRRRRDRRPTGVARRIIKITAFLCVLAILAVVGPPLVSRAVTAVRDRMQPSDPIRPVEVTASSSADEDTAPQRIADGATNRYWAPQGAAVDAWVEATFAAPIRVTDILIHSGISPNQEQFLTVGRPHELALIATTDGGDIVEDTLVLRDRPGEQKFTFRASNVVRIRLVIRSAFGPESRPAVALAEVEFFGRT